VRRIGSRDFLVGEFFMKDVPEEWKGTVLWIPVDSIDTLTVFPDKAKALAAAEQHQKEAEKK
jgi:hypothetical protein